MSKNLTRKGLAFGAGIALVASGLAGLPAQADTTGPVTLLADGSGTFNSITTAGITLTATLDPALQANPVDSGLEGLVVSGVYVVTNPSGHTITIDAGAAVTGYLLYNASGNTSDDGSAASTTYQEDDLGTPNTVGTLFVDFDAGNDTYITNATKIVVKNGAVDGGASAKDTLGAIKITSASTSTTVLTVQSIMDSDAAGPTTTGKVGAFENSSDAVTVTLYPLSAVSATTSITGLDRSTSGSSFGVFTGTVVYGNSINNTAVLGKTYYSLFKDGLVVSLDPAADLDTANVNVVAASSAGTLSRIILNGFKDNGAATTSAVAAAFGAGVYSVQAYYSTDSGTTLTAIGAASAVVDLNNGLVADIATTDAYMTENANVDFASNTAGIRTGTNAVSVLAKSQTSASPAVDIAAGGIRYRATVTAVDLSATSTVAVSGSASSLAKDDDVVVAFATSDATGKVSFTLTNAGAIKGDKVTVAVQSLKADGTFTAADTVTLTWADAALSSFTAVPGNFISGDNPTLTFKTTDQFGSAVSATAVGALSVTVQAKIGGVVQLAKLNQTKTVTDGTVAFTFANFATTAIPAQVEAQLFQARTASTVITVNLYATSSTNTVTALDEYGVDVTYIDYVLGDRSTPAVAAEVERTGIASIAKATITGSVQNASAVGQPGAAIVVAAEGVLFYDESQTLYAKDSITIFTNEFGTYSVEASTQTLNAAGQVVTLTSGGKTATTLLKSHLPVGVGAKNLAFSWDLPATLVKNTTYVLTATLTDKWGNPVRTFDDSSVTFTGNGSIQVNGLVSGSAAKNFDATGKAVVFIRSIKDIAGPGSITATLNAVANQYAVSKAALSDERDQFASLVADAADSKATAWNETLFKSELTALVDVLDVAPEVVSTGIVNAGSFNNAIAVYAKGYKGDKLSWKIAGKWFTTTLTQDYQVFQRSTIDVGVNVLVDIYINGQLQLAKSVLTR